MSLSVSPAQTAAWRKQIFEQLSERTRREIDNFKHYEQAIEQVPSQPCTLPPVSFISMSFDSFTWSNPVAVCVGEEGKHAVVERLEAT